MSVDKHFRQDIPVKFIFEDWVTKEHPGSIGYHAEVKCGVCGKWNIRVYPKHEEKNREGLYIKRQLSLEILLKEMIPIIKKPLCSRCSSGADILREKEQIET